jgi:hypothetical protein
MFTQGYPVSFAGTFYNYKFLPYFTCVNSLCDVAALLRVRALRSFEALRNFGRSNDEDESGFGRE